MKILQGHNLVEADEWRFISGTAAASAGVEMTATTLATAAAIKEEEEEEEVAGARPLGWTSECGRRCRRSARCPLSEASASPADGFRRHEEDWRAFYDAVEPQRCRSRASGAGTGPQLLPVHLRFRCMRVDKVPDAVMAYVIEKSKWSKRE